MGFSGDEFSYLGSRIRHYIATKDEASLAAVVSNNLNLILASLAAAGPVKPSILNRVREASGEIIAREMEELSDIADQNCYAAGYASGAIDAAKELLECLDEEIS